MHPCRVLKNRVAMLTGFEVGDQKYDSPHLMKDGPMNQLIQDIRNQVISPAFVPLLDAMGINFYDGCLLVEIVQDLDSSSPSTSSSLDDPSSSHSNEVESDQLPTLST
ncbi:hypothetical protein BT69DRAFT_1351503, partial [Atractiella rhizophila]